MGYELCPSNHGTNSPERPCARCGGTGYVYVPDPLPGESREPADPAAAVSFALALLAAWFVYAATADVYIAFGVAAVTGVIAQKTVSGPLSWLLRKAIALAVYGALAAVVLMWIGVL